MLPTFKKSALLVLLYMLWSLLAGCANQTYEQLEEEYTITGDRTKLDQRESVLLRAEEFFNNKEACFASDKHAWICTNVHNASRVKRTQKNMSIDRTIRKYQIERTNGCGCADEEALRRFMQDLTRQMGY